MNNPKHIGQNELPTPPWGWPSGDLPLELWKVEDVTVKNNKEEISGEAMFYYKLLPSPRVFCRFNTDKKMTFNNLLPGQNSELWLKREQMAFKVFCKRIYGHQKAEFLVCKPVEPEDRQAKNVVFYLLNFPNFHSAQNYCCDYGDGRKKLIGHIILETDQWRMELTARENLSEIIKSEAKFNGYAATHSGHLTRRDSAPITQKEARDALMLYRYFLSFACGRWCGFDIVNSVFF